MLEFNLEKLGQKIHHQIQERKAKAIPQTFFPFNSIPVASQAKNSRIFQYFSFSITQEIDNGVSRSAKLADYFLKRWPEPGWELFKLVPLPQHVLMSKFSVRFVLLRLEFSIALIVHTHEHTSPHKRSLLNPIGLGNYAESALRRRYSMSMQILHL